MLKLFRTNDYDEKIAVISGDKKYSILELKKLIVNHIEALKNKKNNIVISTSDNFSFLVQFLASIFSFKNIYLVSDRTKINSLDFDFDTIDDIPFEENNNLIFPNINPKEIVINFFTSGSSKKPKIIKKSLYNLISEAYDIAKEFDIKNKELEVISTTTMCHLFGMTFQLMFPICNGLIINTKKIAYPENVDINNTILVSTPGFLNSVLKYDIKFEVSPKYIISAGSKLENNLFEYLEKQSNIIEIYGSTESGIIAHKTHFSDDFTLFKNVEIQVNEENVKVISQYSFNGSCLINDKVEVFSRNLKIKNRTDRLFKIQEKRISAEELENTLINNNLVKNCYILKVDEKLGCLCVLSNLGQDFILQYGIVELIKKLKQYLIKYSEIIPQKWKFIDEIPINKTGKTDKSLIEHIFNINLSLPVILDRKLSKDTIIYKLFFYNQCNFFQGHFPEFKILPGVVQLYFAKEFANKHFGLNLGAGQWKRIKFSNIIKSDSIVELKLENNDTQINFEYIKESCVCSSGVFLCENIFEKIFE